MSKFIQINFFYPSTFSLLTKQNREKIKSFPSSYYFLFFFFFLGPGRDFFFHKLDMIFVGLQIVAQTQIE